MRAPRILDSALGAAAVFVALAAILSLPGLGAQSLVRMEGMIAAIAGEMLASGDYLVSRLYGEIYTYKPPLLYWLVAAAFRVTGSTAEWVVRLPAALSSLLMGLGTLLFAGRIAGYRRGLLAAVAATTGALSLQKLRIAEFDAPLAAFVGIAIVSACYALALDGERGAGRAWWVCYPALAAGVLTKGVPALMLFAPGLLAATVLAGRPRVPSAGARAPAGRPPGLAARFRVLGRWQHLLGLLLFILIVVTYLGSAYAAAGWEVFRQPLEEARLRGTEWSVRAAGRTLLKPIFIVGYFLPWSVALFFGLPPRRFGRRQSAATTDDRFLQAAWGFLIAGTLVSMTVPTHESRYYLPLAVPVALVCSAALTGMAELGNRAARLLPAALAGTTGLLSVALALVPASPVASAGARAALAGLGTAALAVAASTLARAKPARPTTALLMAALCFWGAETYVFGPERAAGRDQRRAAAELRPSVPEEATIWVLSPAGLAGSYSGLLHYLGRPVRTFDGAVGPPPGALCLLRESDLGRVGPTLRERLEPVASARGPRWTYLLYRAPTRTSG